MFKETQMKKLARLLAQIEKPGHKNIPGNAVFGQPKKKKFNRRFAKPTYGIVF